MLSENVKLAGNVLKLTRDINCLRLLSSHPLVAVLVAQQVRMGKKGERKLGRENIILQMRRMEINSNRMMAMAVEIVPLEVTRGMMKRLLPRSMLKLLNSPNRRQNLEKMNGE